MQQRRTPRPYQEKLINEVMLAWGAGYRAPLVILPTGGGKTFIFSYLTEQHAMEGGTVLIQCHRSELIQQISLSLATQGVVHDFICSDKDRALCGNLQQKQFGRTYYQHGAKVIIASMQTLSGRLKDPNEKKYAKDHPKYVQQTMIKAATLKQLQGVTLGVYDEAHHLLRDNNFGCALPHLPTFAKLLLVTATPERADGKGIGCEALGGMGVADIMVRGPEMRELIAMGNLCDYDLFEPETEQIDMTGVSMTASGDHNLEQLSKATNKASITGDVIRYYKSEIYGKLTIVFCCDITHAQSVADAYNAAGIPADTLHGGTDGATRFKTIERFANRELWVLATVDVVSEGFDLPAIEAAQFLRKTASLSWWMQAFGRVLRPLAGKDRAIVLDHVGNCRNPVLGLPDRPRHWSLANRKGARAAVDPDVIPNTTCRNKTMVEGNPFAAFLPEQVAAMTEAQREAARWKICGKVFPINVPGGKCPRCGQRQPIVPVGLPVVDKSGNLVKMSIEELDRMRAGSLISDQAALWRSEVQGDMLLLKISPEEYVNKHYFGPRIGVNNIADNHRRWRGLQAALRPLMDEWMEYHQRAEISQEAAQQLFINRFGVNVYHAQVLKPKECNELIVNMTKHLESIRTGGLNYVS